MSHIAFKYIVKLVLSNIVGASVSFVAALTIFYVWQSEGTMGQSSPISDAFSVSTSLLSVGLVYSFTLVTPLFLLLRKSKVAMNICFMIIAVIPGSLLWGSFYWDILALSFGISSMLFFIGVEFDSKN